jgi:hypothetical protein
MGQLDRIVINASAARKFGFASPQDAVGKILSGINEEDKQVQVVGVAPDIRHRSAVALGSTLRPALAAVRIRPARALRD